MSLVETKLQSYHDVHFGFGPYVHRQSVHSSFSIIFNSHQKAFRNPHTGYQITSCTAKQPVQTVNVNYNLYSDPLFSINFVYIDLLQT